MEIGLLLIGPALFGFLVARCLPIGIDSPFLALVGGYRARDRDWPVGVQEEDRDQRWGTQVSATQAPVEPELKPVAVRVKAVVRIR